MRELKFRVWNNEIKKYDPCFYPIFSYSYNSELKEKTGYCQIIGMHDDNNHEQLIEDNMVNFEEYIGRKDNNGKEIYRGDIVEIEFTYIFGELLKRRGEIKYSNKYAQYYIKIYNDDYLSQLDFNFIFESIKIIGNINENFKLSQEV